MKRNYLFASFLVVLLLLTAGCTNQSENQVFSSLPTDDTGGTTSSADDLEIKEFEETPIPGQEGNLPDENPENRKTRIPGDLSDGNIKDIPDWIPGNMKDRNSGDMQNGILETAPDGVTEDMSETASEDATATISSLVDFNVIPVKNSSMLITADADITLKGDSVSVTGTGVTVNGTLVTITKAGTYLLTGTLNDGQVIVNTSDEAKVRLIFNGVDIYCSNSAPIYVMSSPKKTEIVLPEESVNYLEDGSEYLLNTEESADNPSAVIYSKDDLEIEGYGSLYIKANYEKGIFSKDDLKIKGGILQISAVDDGIRGKDSVVITDGEITVYTNKDGIRTSNETDTAKGNIDINGGVIKITSSMDGIQAITNVNISGGEITINSGGGSMNGTKSAQNDFGGFGGGWKGFGGRSENTTQAAEADTISRKGIKAGALINITGAVLQIDSADDTIHSNGTVDISGGELRLTSGDDGIHAEDTLNIREGSIIINKSYEGIEGVHINISGGDIRITSSDDGINAAGGTNQSGAAMEDGWSFGRGGGMFSGSTGDAVFSGGTVVIDTSGDGIDVNGSAVLTGGTYIVHGPTNNGNAALDYDGAFTVDGGTLVALGSSGMAQSVTSNTQGVLAFTATLSSGALLHMEDEDGRDVLTINTIKSTECIVFTDPELKSNKEYSVYVDGTLRGSITTK